MDKLAATLMPYLKRGLLFHLRLTGLVLLLLYSSISTASSIEQKIKVAYIYNFTKFITWPEHLGNTFNLCLLNNDSFGILFNSLESKTALGMPIKLIRLHNLETSVYCHILFIGDNPQANILQSVPQFGVLTISEKSQLIQDEGIIQFVTRNGKVKLQINIDHAEQAGLIISAKLLEIAELVERGEDD